MSKISTIVGLFIAGYKLGRIERKKGQTKSKTAVIRSILTIVIIFGVFGWLFFGSKIMDRTVTLVTKDGHSLPFASVIIHTNDCDRYARTDNAGNIIIPRFGVNSLTVKDARYVEHTWDKSEIEQVLTVERTLLGSGLDAFADRLLKPKKE